MVLLHFAQIISSAAYCLGEIPSPAPFPGTLKKKVITIPFTPTRPISNNAASIFHNFSNPLSFLCTAYSHCLLLLPLFPSLSASSCSFHSITLSFTLHAYVWLPVLSAIPLHAGVLGYVFCPILMPPQILQQSATSAGLEWSVTQPPLPHSRNNRFTAVCVDENNLYDIASHKANPSSVPWGIMDSYCTLPWVTWEAVTILEGINRWGLLWHRLANGALVYPSQGGRYRVEGWMALG